jgi:hypothetical protein
VTNTAFFVPKEPHAAWLDAASLATQNDFEALCPVRPIASCFIAGRFIGAIGIQLSVGAKRECGEHGFMRDRSDMRASEIRTLCKLWHFWNFTFHRQKLHISPTKWIRPNVISSPLTLAQSGPIASVADLNRLDAPLVSGEFFAGASFFCFRLGIFNQAVRAPLNFVAKRPNNFVARLFAFERVSVDPYLQLVFACVVLVFYFWVL